MASASASASEIPGHGSSAASQPGQPINKTSKQPSSSHKGHTLKHWWHRLVFHSSYNSDKQAAPPSAMHQRTYVPRHAHRDAMLALPLAERKAAAERVHATKHSTPGEGLAVHPNQQVAMARLKSFTGSKRAKCASWSASESGSPSLRGSSGGAMESIGEDEDADGCADGALHGPSPAVVARLSRSNTARVRFSHQHVHSCPSSARAVGLGRVATDAEPGSSSPSWSGVSATPQSSATSDDNAEDGISVSGYEVRRRLQEVRQQNVARKLQEQTNPSVHDKGKGKARAMELGREQSLHSHSQPQVSFFPRVTPAAPPATEIMRPRGENASLAPTSGTAAQDTTMSAARSITIHTSSDATIRPLSFPLPPSSLTGGHERNDSEDTCLSSPLETTSANTSDADWRNGSVDLSSSATSVEGDGDGAEGEGLGKKGEKGKVEVDDDWTKRVVEVAKAS